MPSRIHFDARVPIEDRPRIATGLVPLADHGYEVFVESADVLPRLGWGVRLSRPHVVKTFRTTAATPNQWASFVARVLRAETY